MLLVEIVCQVFVFRLSPFDPILKKGVKNRVVDVFGALDKPEGLTADVALRNLGETEARPMTDEFMGKTAGNPPKEKADVGMFND